MTSIRHFLLLWAIFVWTVQTVCAQPANPAQFALDCTFRDGNDIFTPQQSVILDVILRPLQPNTQPFTPSPLHATLTDVSQPENPLITGFNTPIGFSTPSPISFITPNKEGVYEITLTVVLTAGQENRTNRPFQIVARSPSQQVLTVQRQFLVLTPHIPPRTVGNWTLTERRDLPTVAEPPSRRLLLPFPKVAELPKLTDFPKPSALLHVPSFGRRTPPEGWHTPELYGYGSQYLHLPAFHGQFLEKSERNPEFSALSAAGSHECSWYSMPLDVKKGTPYLIEIDYPINIPQTLGLGIVDYLIPLELSGGMVGPVNTAADIHVAEEIVQDTPTHTTAAAATHQLLFWAATESPELVLVNRQPGQEALFRNIRISRIILPGQQGDPRLPKLFEGQAQRKRIGQILGANSFKHLKGGGESTDIQKAYEECSHLIDRLCQGGYDGITLTVLSKDSSLYPAVKSPAAKESFNALEMMFRRFDSEGLTLIPAIEFDMPIPSLEQLLQQYPGITEEILMGDSQVRRYNVLHPDVQRAMSEIVLDLADRFGHHPSFGGIALVLSPESYAQLPFVLYPPDDHTFMQFRQDTERELGIPFPDEQHLRSTMPIQQFLAHKNTERVRFLQSDQKIWETWVRWRMATISGFYADLAKHLSSKQIAAERSDAPLYLLGGTILDLPDIRQFCTPTLSRNFAPLQALQLLGFDLQRLAKAESLHFLRPVQIAETKNYCYEGLNSADAVALFSRSGIMPGVQFVHKDTDYFVTTPAYTQSRKRFVQQLAQADVLMFMDGGVFLPLGQEPALFELLDTYRQLPPVPFQTFQPSTANPVSLQPLTIRYNHSPEGLIVYIVNDAPFSVEADFFFTVDPRSSLTELTGQRMVRSLNRSMQRGSHTWRASLLPYDLLAVRINDAHAKIDSVSVLRPSSLCGTEGTLKQKVEELSQRIYAAQNGVLWNGLVNADFELPLDTSGKITGWQCFGQSLTALPDHTVVCKGRSSIKLMNGAAEPGTFLSQPLPIPATGRLGVSMFVGVPADYKVLPMNVILSAKYRDKPYYRNVPVGETLMQRLANVEPKNGVRWHRLVVPFERLPTESLEEVRIGVQYLDSGTVWLDDITLYQVLFSANEILDLKKMLVVAQGRCSDERVSDLISLLEGYWMQLLFQYAPVSQISPPPVLVPKPPAQLDTGTSKSPTLYQRVKGWAETVLP